MAFRRKEFYVTNASAISSGTLDYPLSYSGGPSDLDRRENFPLKNFKVENKSGVPITVLLDPIGAASNIKWTVPDGQTLASEPKDDFTFFNIAIINDGGIDIEIGELNVNVRNY